MLDPIYHMALKYLKIAFFGVKTSKYFHCSVFWITSDFSIHLMQNSNAHDFLICERKYQVWECIFIVRT